LYDKDYKAWFYLTGNGAMKVGWAKIDGSWYFLAGNGAMKYGWQTISGKRYYFGGANDGKMRTSASRSVAMR
jgi:glucan-binding YG repeat protein